MRVSSSGILPPGPDRPGPTAIEGDPISPIRPISDAPTAETDRSTEGDDSLRDRLAGSCRGGNREDFAELVALTEPVVRSLVGRLAHDRAEVDDLVQETYSPGLAEV